MKTFLLALITLLSSSLFAQDMAQDLAKETTTPKRIIEESYEFGLLTKEFAEMGGSFTCANYQVVSKTTLISENAQHTLEVQLVSALCTADDNDGTGTYSKSLNAYVSVVTDTATEEVIWNFESLSLSEPAS